MLALREVSYLLPNPILHSSLITSMSWQSRHCIVTPIHTAAVPALAATWAHEPGDGQLSGPWLTVTLKVPWRADLKQSQGSPQLRMPGLCPTNSSRSTDLTQVRCEGAKHISTQCWEHSSSTALMSCTGLMQAVEQASPELVSSLQGLVTLSQIFFFFLNKRGWVKQVCTSSGLHSPVKVIDLKERNGPAKQV